MMNKKTLDTIFAWYRFGSWVLREHPEIHVEYINSPFKHLCPRCKGELINANSESQYWFCPNCTKSYTIEELKNAKLQQEDNPTDGL